MRAQGYDIRSQLSNINRGLSRVRYRTSVFYPVWTPLNPKPVRVPTDLGQQFQILVCLFCSSPDTPD